MDGKLLAGKTAVITGASRGIGKAIALAMAAEGANLAILDIQEAGAQAVCQEAAALGVKATAYGCDITDFAKSKAVIAEIKKEFGTIDILVNNAGIIRDGLILTMTEDDFDAVIATNLKGAFHMTKHVYQIMMRQRKGSIINIVSVAGMFGNAGQANYAAAKAGLIGLTKTTARELAGRGVTCNAIAPGFIETDMTATLSDAVKENALAQIPLKHMGKPEDIAHAAVFLASDWGSYITGEVLKVDGGLYI